MSCEPLWQDYWTTADCMTLIDEKSIHSQHATVNFLLKYKQWVFKRTSLLLCITIPGALIEEALSANIRKYLNGYIILYANNIHKVRIFIIFYHILKKFIYFSMFKILLSVLQHQSVCLY